MREIFKKIADTDRFVAGFLLNRFDRRRCNKIRKTFIGREMKAYNIGNEQYDVLTINDVSLWEYNRNLNLYRFVFKLSNGASTSFFLDGTLYNDLNQVDNKQLGMKCVIYNSDCFENFIVLDDIGNACLKTF